MTTYAGYKVASGKAFVGYVETYSSKRLLANLTLVLENRKWRFPGGPNEDVKTIQHRRIVGLLTEKYGPPDEVQVLKNRWTATWRQLENPHPLISDGSYEVNIKVETSVWTTGGFEPKNMVTWDNTSVSIRSSPWYDKYLEQSQDKSDQDL